MPETLPSNVQKVHIALPQIALAELALEELRRRVAKANEAVAARQRTNAQLQPTLRTWAAIAAWFHADVRPLLMPQPGVACEEPPDWIDFCPATEPADKALLRLAHEIRRAYEVALAREGTDPERAANLARLDQSLSIAAGLPAWQPAPKPAEQVAA